MYYIDGGSPSSNSDQKLYHKYGGGNIFNSVSIANSIYIIYIYI